MSGDYGGFNGGDAGIGGRVVSQGSSGTPHAMVQAEASRAEMGYRLYLMSTGRSPYRKHRRKRKKRT